MSEAEYVEEHRHQGHAEYVQEDDHVPEHQDDTAHDSNLAARGRAPSGRGLRARELQRNLAASENDVSPSLGALPPPQPERVRLGLADPTRCPRPENKSKNNKKSRRTTQKPRPNARPVQMRGGHDAAQAAVSQGAAAQGVQGSGSPLPHLSAIQNAFGPDHDVSGVKSFVGGAAQQANDAMGSEAYVTDESVAFKNNPSLSTAAHEAAHVVQQRQGVNLPGGVGTPGDAYELQADAVAERVVAGQSAADLLGSPAAPDSGGGAVQHKKTWSDHTGATFAEQWQSF